MTTISRTVEAAFADSAPAAATPPPRACGTTSRRESIRFGTATRLTCERLERAAGAAGVSFSYADDAIERMSRARAIVAERHAAGEPFHGPTTGHGALAHAAADACRGHREGHGIGIVSQLAAGWGGDSPREVVRAAMIARARSLAKGMSGIDPAVATALLGLLEHDVTPCVPRIGSVGASGDLVAMSHVAAVMTGRGRARTGADPNAPVVDGAAALAACGLDAVHPSERDALALANGTSFMTAWAGLAIARAERLIARAEALTGRIYRVLGAREQALDPRLHLVRGHAGQMRSAAAIRRHAADGGPWEDATRPLREACSIRCAPQFLGACREQLDHARRLVERELDGVNDEPIVWSGLAGELDDPAVLHGGHFQGQQIAFAADALNQAMVQVAILAERQLAVLLDPELNGGVHLRLAREPGPDAGMVGAELTAIAVTAEMRHHGAPTANASMPTTGRHHEVVSTGLMAARQAYDQTDRLGAVLGILAIAAERLDRFHAVGRIPGPAVTRPDDRLGIERFEHDMPRMGEVDRLARCITEG